MAKRGQKTPKVKESKKITPAERESLRQVNVLLKSAKAQGLLSQSKPLGALNKLAKQHKNKRLSIKDYREQKSRIERLLNSGTDIEVLRDRKEAAKARKKARSDIGGLEKSVSETLEKIRNLSPYISKQAAEIRDLMDKLQDPKQRKNMTTDEINKAKEKIKDYTENFGKHKEEIEKGMRNYARLLGIEEEDLYRPEVIEFIEEAEDLDDSDDWYEYVSSNSDLFDFSEKENIEDIIEAARENREQLEAEIEDQNFYSFNNDTDDDYYEY